MNMRMKDLAGLIVMAFTTAFTTLSQAATEECVTANPNNVDDVQRCISRIPGISSHYNTAMQFFSCSVLQDQIVNAQGEQPAGNARRPTCRTLSEALMKQNGKRPAWTACTDYDGSQRQLNQCLQPVVQEASKNGQLLQAGCTEVLQRITVLVHGNNDTQFNIRKNPPTCEMIASGLSANGVRMMAAECLGYRANDPRHIQQCLEPTLTSVRSRVVNIPTCDQSRQIYNQLLLAGNAKMPEGYAVPACSMIDPIVANILGNPAVASTPAPTGNNPVANLPAAAAIPSAAGNTAQYPAAQYPATPNPTTQYPASQQYPDYSASANTSKEQQRAQRRQERAAEIQSGANAASQILGTLGIGSGAAPAPGNNSTVNTGTSGQATPVYNGTETENQRKIREQQQKVNDAQQTMQSVKGVLDMFGGSK